MRAACSGPPSAGGAHPRRVAVATIAASTIMAAMVGVIGAEIVTLGLVCLPAMPGVATTSAW